MNRTTPVKTLADAITVIEDTADFYHAMSTDTYSYWWHNYWAALDLLERIQGLEEGSLIKEHDNTCNCMCKACDALVQAGGRGAACDNCIACPEHCRHS